MHKSVIFLFFILASAPIYGQTPDSLPKIKEIVKEFYGIYNNENLEYPFVAFEKRKDGWYIVTQKIENHQLEVVNKFLFYDNQLRRYNSLSLEKNIKKKDINPEDYLDDYNLRNFDAQYFYGYKGWYKEVIRELEDKKYLSDDQMNCLARAYSTCAAGLLSDQYGDTPENEIWRLPLKINCLSPGQINQFNSLEEKAQKYFKRLADRNPNYETIVGRIGMKYANEIMFQYTVLLAYANDFAVKIKLPADLYTEEQLRPAKLFLENCPKGAIFLSFGDNDFYPLHYLQQAKAIRRDVYLVNYSLIALDRYIYRCTKPQYDALPVRFSCDTSLYKGNMHEVIYVEDSANSVAFSSLIKLMKSGKKDDWGRVTLKADKILLSKNKSPNTKPLTAGAEKAVLIKETKYILRNQWILLDILNNLNGRKICFPNNFSDELKGLNDHLLFTNGLYIYNN